MQRARNLCGVNQDSPGIDEPNGFAVNAKPANQLGTNLALRSPAVGVGGVIGRVAFTLPWAAIRELAPGGGTQHCEFRLAQAAEASLRQSLEIIHAPRGPASHSFHPLEDNSYHDWGKGTSRSRIGVEGVAGRRIHPRLGDGMRRPNRRIHGRECHVCGARDIRYATGASFGSGKAAASRRTPKLVATANLDLKFAVGSSRWERPTVGKAPTVATRPNI